jgi:hypothetical protein
MNVRVAPLIQVVVVFVVRMDQSDLNVKIVGKILVVDICKLEAILPDNPKGVAGYEVVIWLITKKRQLCLCMRSN